MKMVVFKRAMESLMEGGMGSMELGKRSAHFGKPRSPRDRSHFYPTFCGLGLLVATATFFIVKVPSTSLAPARATLEVSGSAKAWITNRYGSGAHITLMCCRQTRLII
jgi:hypothetical protein